MVDTVKVNHFCVATEVSGFSTGSLTYNKITCAFNNSLATMKCFKLDLYCFYGPDTQTALDESYRAISQLHLEGLFDLFGVSNFYVDKVTEIVTI